MAASDQPRPDEQRLRHDDLDELLTPSRTVAPTTLGALDDLLTPEPPRVRKPVPPPRPQRAASASPPPPPPEPEAAPAPEPPPEPFAPAAKLTMDQDELDALMDELGVEAPAPRPRRRPAPKEVEVDPEHLNALLTELGFEPDAPGTTEEAPAPEPEADEAKTHEAEVDPDELNALLTELGMEPDEAVPAPADSPADTHADAPPAEENAGGVALDQDELDALLAGGSDALDDPVREDAPPDAPSAEDASTTISQDELDSLLSAMEAEPEAAGLDDAIAGPDLDASIDTGAPASPDDAVLSGDDPGEDTLVDAAPRDAVADDEDELPAPEADPAEAGDPAGAVGEENHAAATGAGPEDLLDDEALDALVGQAVEEAGAPGDEAEDIIAPPSFEPDAERADEAGGTEEPPMDPDIAAAIDLEALVVPDVADVTDLDPGAAPESAPPADEGESEGEAAPKGSRVKLPAIRIVLPSFSMQGVLGALQQNAIRIATATSAGMVVTMGTFTLLITNPVREPAPAEMETIQQSTLDEAVAQARAAMAAERYGEAASVLDGAIARFPDSPALADARFLRIEAAYRAMGSHASERELIAFYGEVNEFELAFPADPRVARALAWEADLYEREGRPYDARRSYRKIEANFPNYDDMPGVLLASARLELATDQPKEALATLETLMRDYPGAPVTSEARLLLAQTYAASGDRRRAREMLEGIARTQPHTGLGAAATAHLARLAFEEGRYEDAIDMLEGRRRRATTIEGNDEVYLLLAQAYRDAGQGAEAERVLRELIDFFPDTPLMPQAYLALSNLLEREGRREDALRLANLALDRFDDDPAVMRNAAELLERAGRPAEAAELYMAAEAIDGGDPTTRLRAGRAYLEAGDPGRARETLGAIADAFPGTPEAVSAGIEWARATHRAGEPEEAMARLRSLRDQTLGQPAQTPVLLAMAEIYADLGLPQPLAEVQRDIAALTNEPQRIAQAAIDMIDAGLYEPGFAAAARVDAQAVRPETAYELMTRHARALLRSDAGSAIGMMERAIEEFPAYRTPKGDRALFHAYLGTDQPALARVMLADLEQQARRDPLLHDHSLDLANKLGDYYFQRGDYRAALDAYGRVLDAPYANGQHGEWAAFQRANALVRIREFDEALEAYEQLIAQGSQWANEAALRVGLLEVERRLRRGQPLEAAAR